MSDKPTAALVLFAVTTLLMAKALYAIFIEVPTEITMGVVQRIFYFHAPSGIAAFMAFFASAVFSIAYLVRRDLKWDRWAVSSAEVGVVFCTVVLVTGPIWAKPVWGIWWTWDARLTTTFILWLLYVGYLMLRGFLEEPSRRAAISAVFSIISCIDVPIVYMANRWWRTQHPQPVIAGGSGSGLDPQMAMGLLQAMIAITALGVFLVYQRAGLEKARQQVDDLRREVLS